MSHAVSYPWDFTRKAVVFPPTSSGLSFQDATGIISDAPISAAQGLAQRLEADLIAEGWQTGKVFGTEKRLTEKYAVSPYLLRQALRIMENRGIGQVQRGTPGGLILQKPSAISLGYTVGMYLQSLKIRREKVLQFGNSLNEYLSKRGNKAADTIVGEIVSGIKIYFKDRENEYPSPSSNRAMVVARRIIRDCSVISNSPEKIAIGTIDDLGIRYHTCRPVMTQAVRILEDFEVVTTIEGRNGGLLLRRPSPMALRRLTFVQLAARGVNHLDSRDVIWSVNRANAAVVADRSGRDQDYLRWLSEQISIEDFMNGAPWGQVALFRYLADMADDPVTHMLVRCFFLFEMRPRLVTFERSRAVRSCDATKLIIEAVIARKPHMAEDAVMECRQAMFG